MATAAHSGFGAVYTRILATNVSRRVFIFSPIKNLSVGVHKQWAFNAPNNIQPRENSKGGGIGKYGYKWVSRRQRELVLGLRQVERERLEP